MLNRGPVRPGDGRLRRWWPFIAVVCGGGVSVLALLALLAPPFAPRRTTPLDGLVGLPAEDPVRGEVAAAAPAEAPRDRLNGNPPGPAASRAAAEPAATSEAWHPPDALPVAELHSAPAARPAPPPPPRDAAAGNAAAGLAWASGADPGPAAAASPPDPAECEAGGLPPAADAETAAGTASSPPGPMLRIHHRAGSAAGRAAAGRIAEEALKAGVPVLGISAEPAGPRRREVRYVHQEDAAEAERLAARFRGRWGNSWRVVRVETASEPADHALEVWLPHR
jgi:hypothetical protein